MVLHFLSVRKIVVCPVLRMARVAQAERSSLELLEAVQTSYLACGQVLHIQTRFSSRPLAAAGKMSSLSHWSIAQAGMLP